MVKGSVFIAIVLTFFFFSFGDISATLGAGGNSLVKKGNAWYRKRMG